MSGRSVRIYCDFYCFALVGRVADLLHDFWILEIDESFAFGRLGDGGEIRVVFCKCVEVDVPLVVWCLFHDDDVVGVDVRLL